MGACWAHLFQLQCVLVLRLPIDSRSNYGRTGHAGGSWAAPSGFWENVFTYSILSGNSRPNPVEFQDITLEVAGKVKFKLYVDIWS